MSCQLYSTDASCPKDAADQDAEESRPLARWQLQPKVHTTQFEKCHLSVEKSASQFVRSEEFF